MKVVVTLGLLLLVFAFPAAAGAQTQQFQPSAPLQNRQAQAVAASRQCWRVCQTQCAAELQICGHQFPGSECLPRMDACDRACQRSCRYTGSPLLDFFE